ncbi:DUF2510 domain-containing protein [Streptomyces sp. AJS327]|uniref:RDD family protein n=1 Tax=Streptomyces sp. AJS327 TaxID=2545265 RepID=UPI0015DE4966|nr:RDD family protein [Streptomyces sp. AJS327]MBA0049575.1 DUF2510 domain-containing protein [Streptomyces sp. AJS327]
MSAPSSGSSHGSPSPGFYPDPSIPGYIRYWSGSSWVPGTSRPEPLEGEPMPAPPTSADAQAPGPGTAPSTDETGPVFLDDLDDPGVIAQPADATGETGRPSGPGAAADANARPLNDGADGADATGETPPTSGVTPDEDGLPVPRQRPEPASAWRADASRQSGFGPATASGAQEAGRGGGSADPADGGRPAGQRDPRDPRGLWGTDHQARAEQQASAEPRRNADRRAESSRSPAGGVPTGASEEPGPDDGTFPIRARSREELAEAAREADPGRRSETVSGQGNGPGVGAPTPREAGRPAGVGEPAVPDHTVGLRRSEVLRPATVSAADRPTQPGTPTPVPPSRSTPPGPPPALGKPSASAQGGPGGSGGAGGPGGGAGGPGGGAPGGPGNPPGTPSGQEQPASWAQQVHDLASHSTAPGSPNAPGLSGLPTQPRGSGSDPFPWRPPGDDPFQAAAARQARPAGLGRRFAARLIDAVVTAAVAAAAAFPFVGKASDHIQSKIDAVERAGETQRIWLVDGTTGGYLAIVLGAVLVFGLLYEVLPTARWGRTLGKRLLGVTVLDLERQEPPAFGAALVRWLVYGTLGLAVIGLVNVFWCVVDRPWRQCWHDKAARTFVTGDSTELRL